MFPTRSLLNHVECPDHRNASCYRPSCPFSHSFTKRKGNEEKEEEEVADEKEKKREEPQNGIKRRPGIEVKSIISSSSIRPSENKELSTLLSALNGGPKDVYGAKKEQMHVNIKAEGSSAGRYSVASACGISSSSSLTKQAKHPRPQQSSTSLTVSNGSNLGTISQAPTIARTSHPGTSPVPYASRQSSLQTLFSTFHTLYSALIPRVPSSKENLKNPKTETNEEITRLIKKLVSLLASKDSESTEAKTFKTSNVNFLAYRNSIRTNLVSLSRRQKADKEAEERVDGECISMLGIKVKEAALEMYNNLENAKEKMGHDEKMRKIEDKMMNLLAQSELIGTADIVEKMKAEKKEKIKGSLDRSKMEAANLLTNKTILKAVGFPHPDVEQDESVEVLILEKWGQGDRRHTGEGETMKCDRCGITFTVTTPTTSNEIEQPCYYHWGKKRFVRELNVAKGPRLPRWTCCDALDEATTFASTSLSQIASSAGLIGSLDSQSSPTKGCSQGPHVFKEEDAESLHQRESFLDITQVFAELEQKGERGEEVQTHEVIAFDCELIYTTAGMSLARVTALDEAGKVILDQFVKPRATIVDFNTRFSGIKSADILEGDDVVDLAEARRRLVALMTPTTILVGHGLENDLKAIRLIHMQISDSALLYQHHKGLPFRFGLRDLTLRHLGRHIQGGDAITGHDAEEDARAALGLVRKKYIEYLEGNEGSIQSEKHKTNDGLLVQKTVETMKKKSLSSNLPPRPLMTTYTTSNDGPSAAATASLFIRKRDPKKRKT